MFTVRNFRDSAAFIEFLPPFRLFSGQTDATDGMMIKVFWNDSTGLFVFLSLVGSDSSSKYGGACLAWDTFAGQANWFCTLVQCSLRSRFYGLKQDISMCSIPSYWCRPRMHCNVHSCEDDASGYTGLFFSINRKFFTGVLVYFIRKNAILLREGTLRQERAFRWQVTWPYYILLIKKRKKIFITMTFMWKRL